MLAVAVHEQADAVVTFNLKDFPEQAASPHGVEILHPDAFLLRLLHQRPDDVVEALAVGVLDLRRPPETLNDWLAGLAPVVPMFANLAADVCGEFPETVSSVPALVRADDHAAIASFGEPGDWTNPGQVVFGWYYGCSTISTWPDRSPRNPRLGVTTSGPANILRDGLSLRR